MNVSDKLQVIRALEEKQASRQRRSHWIAWGTVLAAAATLLILIVAGRSQLATIQAQVTEAVANLQRTRADLAQANMDLAAVRAKTDEALRDLQTVDGRGGARSIESAVDTLIEARTTASTTGQIKPPGPVENPAPSDRTTIIEQLYDPSPAVRVKAYGALLPQYRADATLVAEVLAVARQHPDDANGTYNALVVLSHMDAATLRAERDEIESFARGAQRIGPRVAERADTLIRRLPSTTPLPRPAASLLR